MIDKIMVDYEAVNIKIDSGSYSWKGVTEQVLAGGGGDAKESL